MQSEIDDSRLADSLKQYIARLEVENDKIKARVAKLEDKQSQNELIKNLLFVSRKHDHVLIWRNFFSAGTSLPNDFFSLTIGQVLCVFLIGVF